MVSLVEFGLDLCKVAFLYTNARIGNGNDYLSVFLKGFDSDGIACRGILYGVVDNVYEYLTYAVFLPNTIGSISGSL